MCVGGRSKKNSHRENKMDFLFRKFFEFSGRYGKIELSGNAGRSEATPLYNTLL